MERYQFLIERMWEELHDAKTYAHKALMCKEDKAFADVMADLSRQEYNHFSPFILRRPCWPTPGMRRRSCAMCG